MVIQLHTHMFIKIVNRFLGNLFESAFYLQYRCSKGHKHGAKANCNCTHMLPISDIVIAKKIMTMKMPRDTEQ